MGYVDQRQRKSPFVTWEAALAIAGSEEALRKGRHKKTVDNWRTSRKTGKKVVPAAALTEFLLARCSGEVIDTEQLILKERDAAYRAGREDERRSIMKKIG
jgi:hypothetical protein